MPWQEVSPEEGYSVEVPEHELALAILEEDVDASFKVNRARYRGSQAGI